MCNMFFSGAGALLCASGRRACAGARPSAHPTQKERSRTNGVGWVLLFDYSLRHSMRRTAPSWSTKSRRRTQREFKLIQKFRMNRCVREDRLTRSRVKRSPHGSITEGYKDLRVFVLGPATIPAKRGCRFSKGALMTASAKSMGDQSSDWTTPDRRCMRHPSFSFVPPAASGKNPGRCRGNFSPFLRPSSWAFGLRFVLIHHTLLRMHKHRYGPLLTRWTDGWQRHGPQFALLVG